MSNRDNKTSFYLGDPLVYETQTWLNSTYGNDNRYKRVEENGKTGWNTIYALTRSLQIVLDIQETADSFGPTTQRKFQDKWKYGIPMQSESDTTKSNIYGIIQGALACKGYPTGTFGISCTFHESTGNSIKKLKNDAGINNSNATVTLNLMKALLSMNQFVTLESYGGTEEIRGIQQYLNRTYENYVGIIPCDGLYQRDMNTALIKMLQAIEGLAPDAATGSFGPYTKDNLPILPNSNNGEAIKLFRFCLACNGYSTFSSSPIWNDDIVNQITIFQNEYKLPITGKGDLNTWMSLLLSKGNSDRPAAACDCATVLDSVKASALYANGYRYVGRYLSGTVGNDGTSKAMTKNEASAIFNTGMRIFAIFQEGMPSLERYTYDKGLADGEKAVKAARKLGVPSYEVIYFAIDYDIMDGQISYSVIPYFKGIKKAFKKHYSEYSIGIYGARNVCSRVSKEGLSSSSFVSDMSTGFSGNMGYKIPADWAFDQFHEFSFSYSAGSFPLDKVAYSGRYKGFNNLVDFNDDNIPEPSMDVYLSYYKDVLKAHNITAPFGLEMGREYIISAPIMDITFSAQPQIVFPKDPDKVYGEITIQNGEISVSAFDISQEVYNNLDIEITSAFDSNGGLEAYLNVSREIENGTVTTGFGTHNGHLSMEHQVTAELWKNESMVYQICVSITIVYKSIPVDPVLIKQIKNSLIALGYAIVIPVFGLISYAVIPANIGMALTEFLFYHIYSLTNK